MTMHFEATKITKTTPYLAHYFYSLSDEMPVKALFSSLSKKFSLSRCKAELLFDDAKIALSRSFYSVEEKREINFYVGALGELKIFLIVWNSDDLNEQLLDDELIEFSEIRTQTKEVLGTVIGETTIHSQIAPFSAKDFLENLTGNSKTVLSLEIPAGTAFTYATSTEDQNHLYSLEIADIDLANAFLLKQLPHLDLLLHKLKREVKFFEEQRRSFEYQKIDIDKQINASLHKKTLTLQGSESYKKDLESEIDRLSDLYGKLSSALFLTTRSAAALQTDIRKLVNLDIKLSLNNTKSDFSLFYQNLFEEYGSLLKNEEAGLRLSLSNASAAIDIVRTKVDLFRGNEEMALQTQTKELLDQNVKVQHELLALQLATGVIEFVLIFYYTLKSWEAILPEKLTYFIHPLIKLATVSVFSLSLVMLTHFVANRIRKKPSSKGMLLSGSLLLVSLVAMFIISYLVIGLKK